MKIHVVLLNMGGPDKLEDVRPFLFRLFSDPDVIPIPWWLRWLRIPIAWLIAKFRAPKSAANYASIGGGSPQRHYAEAVAKGLQTELAKLHPNAAWTTDICMRFWHPDAKQACANIQHLVPDQILLVPLYPQYSTTTVRSSIRDFMKQAQQTGIQQPIRPLLHWHTTTAYGQSMAENLDATLSQIGTNAKKLILYSAHSIPADRAKEGDPYPIQVQESIDSIQQNSTLAEEHQLVYQSKVGPVEWLGPSVEDSLHKLSETHLDYNLVVVPLSFVSDHIETLEELDIEYRHLAEELGFRGYHRVPVFNDSPVFIKRFAQVIFDWHQTPPSSWQCQNRLPGTCLCHPTHYKLAL